MPPPNIGVHSHRQKGTVGGGEGGRGKEGGGLIGSQVKIRAGKNAGL